MKKVLLLFVSLILVQIAAQSVYAYESVIVDFPEKQSWHAVYYDTQGNESILQYVPVGETYQNWTKTVVFHSYRGANQDETSASFMDKMTAQMELKNPSQAYRYTKYDDVDALATRCVQKNAYGPSQCEIYRVTNSHEALISMHYINKNVQDYKNTYELWYQIIQGVRIYYSYYRNDAILNKATVFQL